MRLHSRGTSLHLFGAAATVFAVALALLYPHFCDAVDPDGTSYLTLARRWASGDWQHAANAYWSPWSPWLTALGIRLGLPEIPAALVQNGAGAVAFLGASLALFGRLRLPHGHQQWLTGGLVGFLLHAVFAQWFDDLWAGAFLLAALAVLLHPDFTARKGYWVLYGALGGLAYFAKAYSLPFFALNTAVCGWWVSGGKPQRWGALLLVCGGTAALLALPWWIALHARYGFWTTGTAGALNLSWGLLGHPIFKEGPQSLLPPPYPGSLVFWEDPWLVNARTVHPWDSLQLLVQQGIRCGYFAARVFWKAALVSPVLPWLGIASAWWLFRKRLRRVLPLPVRMLAAQCVVFPLGLFLVHSESRYLWYLVPVAMALGSLLVAQQGRARHWLVAALALSFWGEPLLVLPQLWHLGRTERAWAGVLREKGLRYGFAASEPGQPTYAVCCRLAFFSGVLYWAGAGDCHDPETVSREMDRHGLQFRLTGPAGRALPGEQLRCRGNGLQLFERPVPLKK